MELPPIINDEMRNIFLKYYHKDEVGSIETVLKNLKENGYSQMQSVFLLIEQLNYSFPDANRAILNSQTWNGPRPIR